MTSSSSPSASSPSPHTPIREDWLALHTEPVLEPELRIVDPHHHLWERADARYLAHELYADVNSGHRIDATVFVQSRSMLRASGPAELAPLGEAEFANGQAAMGASGFYGRTLICDGIVGAADLSLGDAVEPVLEAMARVCGGRLRGIRNPVVWHEHPDVRSSTAKLRPGVLTDPAFRRGAAALARFDLALDIWAYHTQLGDVYELARGLPDVLVVVDHFGGPIGTGPYANDRARLLAEWRPAMQRLASLPNVRVKLGGAGMPVMGFGFERAATPPSSLQVAEACRPYVEPCIEWFGVDRCMFESNFPVDKGGFSYPVLWNAFKRLAQPASAAEKAALFADTAIATYRLQLPNHP
ncbi:MAG TPA: amidohydrolase family protein [Burkholderiaceae bacterium]|jgi:predicted TIM-barrel fold metal-dependent hydrolase